jgi:hypothetical protein
MNTGDEHASGAQQVGASPCTCSRQQQQQVSCGTRGFHKVHGNNPSTRNQTRVLFHTSNPIAGLCSH